MIVIDDLPFSLKGKGETLLIIDDEPSFVEVTKILLEISGYQVLGAKNGLEGIEVFKNHSDAIDVIICDLHMPVLGGSEAINKILEIEPAIKVILISGSIEKNDIPPILIPGRIEFLNKPFHTETLLTTLRTLLK